MKSKGITVARLIEILQTLPPDAPCICGYDGFYDFPVRDGEDKPHLIEDGCVLIACAD